MKIEDLNHAKVITCKSCHFFWLESDLDGRQDCPWCETPFGQDRSWSAVQKTIDRMAKVGHKHLTSL